MNQPIEAPIFTSGQDRLRWSRFKNFDPKTMYAVISDEVFPFIRGMGAEGSAFALH